MTKISTKDWQNLPIKDWNVRTIHQFLIDETRRRFNAEYTPGGKGAKSQRWRTEQGMIKRELDRRGPRVVRKFIEICWAEYYTPNPEKYKYPNWVFMCSYMDRYWTDATQKVKQEYERDEIAKSEKEVDVNWF